MAGGVGRSSGGGATMVDRYSRPAGRDREEIQDGQQRSGE